MDVALAARELLNVEWTQASPFRSADKRGRPGAYRRRPPTIWRVEECVWVERGNPVERLPKGGRLVEADYSTSTSITRSSSRLQRLPSGSAWQGAECGSARRVKALPWKLATQVLGTTPDRIRFHFIADGARLGARPCSPANCCAMHCSSRAP